MQQQTTGQDAIPVKKPTSGKTAKALTGCGGCGCLLGLLSLFAGAFMLAWGLTNRAVDELVGPGAAVLGLAVIIGFFGAALLIGGIIAMKRAKKAEAGQAPEIGGGAQPLPQPAPQQPQPGAGQQGGLPPWSPGKPGGQGPQSP